MLRLRELRLEYLQPHDEAQRGEAVPMQPVREAVRGQAAASAASARAFRTQAVRLQRLCEGVQQSVQSAGARADPQGGPVPHMSSVQQGLPGEVVPKETHEHSHETLTRISFVK